jgi:hypothetical protein
VFTSYCSEQSACTALWHFRHNIVATINVFFFYFCPKKGCPKFCMRPWIRKDYTLLEYFNNPKLKQRDSTKIWYFFEIVIHFWKNWGSLPCLKNLGPLPFLKRWDCLPLKKKLRTFASNKAKVEQFHVPKFGLSESKIMKNKFWWEKKRFLMGNIYILACTRQDKFNVNEFIKENTT